jgi:methyltransferase (TIGR00027 family)
VKLPDLSYMMTVAGLRYIQSIYEPPERRNPDGLVRDLLTPWQRLSCDLRARVSLGKLRAQPFYYYVLLRTQYYDEVYRSAVAGGIRRIVNIGAGSDTRAYRFADEMRQHQVQVLECDQPQATLMKERAARRRWRPDHVSYQPIDLNDDAWPELESWLQAQGEQSTLVMLEGVSPYIDAECWGAFLEFLARVLAAGSRVAYDFKLPAVDAQFGRSARTLEPFRLASDWNEVAAYHAQRGYRLDALQSSVQLAGRLAPSAGSHEARPFEEDALCQLSLAQRG